VSVLAAILPGRARNRVRVEKAPRWRLPSIDWPRVGSAALGIGAVAALAAVIGFALDRPLVHLQITSPNQRVTTLDVANVVRARLRGGFITSNLEEVQHAIEQMPWVDHARVQRRWPGTLVVDVTEQMAVARWGEAGLLNARGELFISDARHVPPELPRLEGPPHTEHQVAELLLRLQPRLLDAGLRTSALRLDARGAWELDLANGVVVRFGRRQLEERIERFLKVGAPVVAGRPNDIASIDMRYSNGFAVGWRTQGAAPARPASADDTHTTRKRDQDA